MTSDMVKFEKKMSVHCELHLNQLKNIAVEKEKGMQNETKLSIQAYAQLLIHQPVLGFLGSNLCLYILLSAMPDILIIKCGRGQ